MRGSGVELCVLLRPNVSRPGVFWPIPHLSSATQDSAIHIHRSAENLFRQKTTGPGGDPGL
jgi:hypothetical protein